MALWTLHGYAVPRPCPTLCMRKRELMLGLQQSFERLIQEHTEPATVLHRLIKKRLVSLGMEITESQDIHLLNQCKNLQDGNFTFDFDDEQLTAAGYSGEENLRKLLQEFFDNLPDEIEKFVKQLEDALPKAIDQSTDEASRLLVLELERLSRRMLKDQHRAHQEFTTNNCKTWKDALDHLEMVVVSALEAGEQYNQLVRPKAVDTNDITFDVLCRLHARACLVSKEVLLLLKHGYSDGAHARWRSIHEIAVVAELIAKDGADLSERYVLHDAIESYKAAQLHQMYASAAGYEPLDDNEMHQIITQYNDLIAKYGKSFHHEYGWASDALRIQKPTFVDLERAVSLSHYRPQYKLASHNVHANPKGILFKLGLFDDEDLLLAGPSNIGLYEPGANTARSLLQITASLVLREATIDIIIICKTLTKLVEKTENAFSVVAVSQEKLHADKYPHVPGDAA